MLIKILNLNVPSIATGLIYTKECFEYLKSKKLDLLGTLSDYPSTIETDISKVSHKVNEIIIEDNAIFANITIMNTLLGSILKQNIDNIYFYPVGYGTKHWFSDKLYEYKLIRIDAHLKI